MGQLKSIDTTILLSHWWTEIS